MQAQDLADVMKGVSNHYRAKILFLLDKEKKLTLDNITERLKANYKTIHVHLARMHKSGLISKRHIGPAVEHSLTKRGLNVLKFLRTLE